MRGTLHESEAGYGLDIDLDWRWRGARWRACRAGGVLLQAGNGGQPMSESLFAFYNHRPRYHHGLSKRDRVEQITGSRWNSVYGVPPYNGRRMRCYGMPRLWGWSTKDCIDGPRSHAWKSKLRRLMRKRARREARLWIQEVSA